MQYKFITVEGNIGAGKTTLSQLLQERLQARLILEQFADNPFLPKFYQDQKRYAFPLELSFLADRYKQLRDILNTRDLFNQYTISDYLFIKSKLFARVNLPEDEYMLYETLFDIIYPNLPKPDLIIYLHAPLSKLKTNIRTRNRSYEQGIPDQYLLQLQDAYEALIRSENYRTLVIDTSQTDFLNRPQDVEKLLALLQKDFGMGQHFINLQDTILVE
ncbi:MAG: deoxynucleoside kinase [Chitinophagaceae bacterium]|nr:deoxynucleoside kinase [Chitinophagaceae bacterium]